MKSHLFKTSLFFIFIFFSLTTIAQHFSIDSVKKALQGQKEDTARVNTLCLLGVLDTDSKSEFNYAYAALNLAKKINFKEGVANSYKSIGIIYSFEQNYDSALVDLLIAVKIYRQLNDKLNTAIILKIMSEIYAYLSNAPEGLTCLTESLQLFEDLRDAQGIASCYLGLATYYRNINGPEALANYYKAVKIFQELGAKRSIADCFENIGWVYYYQQNYTEALGAFMSSLKIDKETNNERGISQCYAYIAKIYKAQGKPVQALEYDSSALKIAISTNNEENKAAAYYAMGEILYQQAQASNTQDVKPLNEAIQNYKGALESFRNDRDTGGMGDSYGQLAGISIRLHQFLQAQKYADSALLCAKSSAFNDNFEKGYLLQAELDSIDGNYKAAYDHYKLYVAYRDSTFNEANAKKLVRSQMQYDFDKKEDSTQAAQGKKDVLAKAEINKQKLIRNSTLGGVGLVGFFSFLLVRSFNRRRRTAFDKQVSEVEMKALRSQMNPHFIFNSLHSINKYMADNDKENASEYLSKFAKLMRLILENSREHEVPLEDDLSALELYMQLESLRFQNRFQYNIQVDPQIDKENTLIPPMLLQPFVENSIIHGLSRKENGMIQIRIQREDNMIRCTVEDNGVGREQSVTIAQGQDKKHGSLGMKITRERLQIINQMKKGKAAINIFDLKDESNRPAGLRVELLLPFETAF